MGEVTKFQPRLYAVQKALEKYASLHPAHASINKMNLDLSGFVTDMLADLYLWAEEGHFDMAKAVDKGRRQASHELKNKEILNGK